MSPIYWMVLLCGAGVLSIDATFLDQPFGVSPYWGAPLESCCSDFCPSPCRIPCCCSSCPPKKCHCCPDCNCCAKRCCVQHVHIHKHDDCHENKHEEYHHGNEHGGFNRRFNNDRSLPILLGSSNNIGSRPINRVPSQGIPAIIFNPGAPNQSNATTNGTATPRNDPQLFNNIVPGFQPVNFVPAASLIAFSQNNPTSNVQPFTNLVPGQANGVPGVSLIAFPRTIPQPNTISMNVPAGAANSANTNPVSVISFPQTNTQPFNSFSGFRRNNFFNDIGLDGIDSRQAGRLLRTLDFLTERGFPDDDDDFRWRSLFSDRNRPRERNAFSDISPRSLDSSNDNDRPRSDSREIERERDTQNSRSRSKEALKSLHDFSDLPSAKRVEILRKVITCLENIKRAKDKL